MIVAVDIETEGLDATKFVIGCVVKENGVKKLYLPPIFNISFFNILCFRQKTESISLISLQSPILHFIFILLY